jgi:hypothetical protein
LISDSMELVTLSKKLTKGLSLFEDVVFKTFCPIRDVFNCSHVSFATDFHGVQSLLP